MRSDFSPEVKQRSAVRTKDCPNRYRLDLLTEPGLYFLVPWAMTRHLKHPTSSLCNACRHYAETHGLPASAFSCRTVADGIEIMRVK